MSASAMATTEELSQDGARNLRYLIGRIAGEVVMLSKDSGIVKVDGYVRGLFERLNELAAYALRDLPRLPRRFRRAMNLVSTRTLVRADLLQAGLAALSKALP